MTRNLEGRVCLFLWMVFYRIDSLLPSHVLVTPKGWTRGLFLEAFLSLTAASLTPEAGPSGAQLVLFTGHPLGSGRHQRTADHVQIYWPLLSPPLNKGTYF